MNKRLAILTLLAAMLALSSFCAATADEYRAFWIDAWHAGFLNQTQVNQLLGVVGDPNSKGTIRDANCNAVFIQVRRNADVCYPSALGEPYMSGLSPSNFNALQAVINAAHDTTGGKQRIEVHCWMVMFRTSGGTVYSLHDDTPTGSLTNLDNYWITRTDTGAEPSSKAFDPGHPLAEEYLTNVALDLVQNFDIDGIHYDYIRFEANNEGYNPTSLARYNAFYGLTGQPTATNVQWQQWRRDQVTNFVRRVYAKVQAVEPSVKVSGAVVTWNPSPASSTRTAFQATRPYYDVYSDWDSWLQEGILDMAVPMTYYDYASLPSDYTRWMNFEKDRHGNRHMIIGPGLYLNSLTNAINELKMTRDPSPSGNYAQGFSGYSYFAPYTTGGTTYGTWANFSPQLVSQVTPTPTNIPDMPWKTNPTKGHISGTLTYTADGRWVDGATVTLTGPENRTQYSDGTGFYAFIDLTPGSYTVTVSKSGYQNIQKAVNVQIGQVTGNMYVTDFSVGGTPPPPVTLVQATNITNNSATITWSTSPQAATSQVEYGLTTSYGSTTPLDSSLVTSHSVQLTGLVPSTLYHYRVISTNVNGTTTSSDYTFTTNGPPTISYPSAGNITATGAVITWTTNTPANGSVNYGTTSSYGSTAADPNTNTTSHSVTLTGLSPQTTYHYQCVSTNSYGTAQTDDLTFTTTAVVTEIVIDNTDPGWSNTSPGGASWTAGTLSTVPHIGTNYLYTAGSGSTSSATRKCRWTPNLSTAGRYDVYVYYQLGANRNNAAPYTVYYNGGSVTSVQNQYSSVAQGNWVQIGSNLPFLAGSSGYVELTNASADTNLVSADAAKWVLRTSTDTTAPVMVSVTAGPYSASTTSLNASWSANDPESGIQRYEYAVGTTAGGTDTKGWTSAGTSTSATITGLSLINGNTYYVSVRAINGVNLISDPMSSGSVTIDTTAPTMISVTDDQYTTSLASLRASWEGLDDESGIQRYEYAVSVTGGGYIKGWTSAGTSTAALISGLSLSVGNTYYVSVRAVNLAGLTSAPMSSRGVTVARSVNSIPEAKALQNEEPISLPVRTVSAAFPGRFYIEETAAGMDRASGIAVESDESVVPNQMVQVYGRMSVIDGYERAIRDSKVVTDGTLTTAVKPMLFSSRDLGGEAFNAFTNGIEGASGVNNIGLLVTIVGKVTYAGDGFIYVDDGFNADDGSGHLGVRVDTSRLTNPPVKDQFVVITGISTAYNTGTAHVRYILPRDTTVTAYDL